MEPPPPLHTPSHTMVLVQKSPGEPLCVLYFFLRGVWHSFPTLFPQRIRTRFSSQSKIDACFQLHPCQRPLAPRKSQEHQHTPFLLGLGTTSKEENRMEASFGVIVHVQAGWVVLQRLYGTSHLGQAGTITGWPEDASNKDDGTFSTFALHMFRLAGTGFPPVSALHPLHPVHCF